MSASGALLSFLGLKEPLGPAAGALESAGDLLFNGAGRKALDEVSARLRAYVGAVPTNHDLEHALRLSMLTTSLVLVETFRRGLEQDMVGERGATLPPFIDAAQGWLHDQIGITRDLTVKTNGDLVRDLDTALDSVLGSNEAMVLQTALNQAQSDAWLELTQGALGHDGGQPPLVFADMFHGRTEGQPGWSIIFQAFIRESLKTSPRVQIAFVTTRLARLRDELPRLARALDGIRVQVDTVLADTTALRQGQEAR